MFRLDYNIDQFGGGFNRKGEIYENTLWRYMEAIYDIFDRVGKRFPNLQLENCSSDGGRTDIGNEEDLTEVLISKRIGGAVLDVFEEEPLNNNLLLKQDNVILTPHVGY